MFIIFIILCVSKVPVTDQADVLFVVHTAKALGTLSPGEPFHKTKCKYLPREGIRDAGNVPFKPDLFFSTARDLLFDQVLQLCDLFRVSLYTAAGLCAVRKTGQIRRRRRPCFFPQQRKARTVNADFAPQMPQGIKVFQFDRITPFQSRMITFMYNFSSGIGHMIVILFSALSICFKIC
ncbi:MAG: hypothetical protein IKN72_03765 [Clostridia bacterium]|nr:hypothetical protein [Clostridia bacterium]